MTMKLTDLLNPSTLEDGRIWIDATISKEQWEKILDNAERFDDLDSIEGHKENAGKVWTSVRYVDVKEWVRKARAYDNHELQKENKKLKEKLEKIKKSRQTTTNLQDFWNEVHEILEGKK